VSTAQELIQRVTSHIGASDTGVATVGDAAQEVTGIAVMSQATLQGLQQAATAKANLVFSYDPVFWTGGDEINRLETDALFLEKRDFIQAHKMVVVTLRDKLRDARSDLIATGMAKALGWQAENPNLFRRPRTSLLGLTKELGAKLNDKTMRVVGDPAIAVATIATSFGNTSQATGIAALNGPADVLVCGYTREWEVVEYAQDMLSAGLKKGLVLLGENASVQPAMAYCAEWIRGFVSEVPVTAIALPEPYWNP